MGAAQGDLIQVTDFQLYLGQQMLNVFYYRVIPVTGMTDSGYDDFLTWFIANVVAKVRVIQVAQCIHTAIELRNLSNALDIRTVATSLAGLRVVDVSTYSPSFVSAGFKLVRESLATRNGYKRISGLTEEDQSGNSYQFPSPAARTDLETAFAATWTVGLIDILEPIIVKRPIDPPVAVGYIYSSIGQAQFTKLGTQNTRKAGVGI